MPSQTSFCDAISETKLIESLLAELMPAELDLDGPAAPKEDSEPVWDFANSSKSVTDSGTDDDEGAEEISSTKASPLAVQEPTPNALVAAVKESASVQTWDVDDPIDDYEGISQSPSPAQSLVSPAVSPAEQPSNEAASAFAQEVTADDTSAESSMDSWDEDDSDDAASDQGEQSPEIPAISFDNLEEEFAGQNGEGTIAAGTVHKDQAESDFPEINFGESDVLDAFGDTNEASAQEEQAQRPEVQEEVVAEDVDWPFPESDDEPPQALDEDPASLFESGYGIPVPTPIAISAKKVEVVETDEVNEDDLPGMLRLTKFLGLIDWTNRTERPKKLRGRRKNAGMARLSEFFGQIDWMNSEKPARKQGKKIASSQPLVREDLSVAATRPAATTALEDFAW